jgi:isopentenyldiphosphate isomerase
MAAAPTPASWLDRVDDADRPAGRVRRREVFEEKAGFRVAHVFVFDRAGRLLLQQLAPGRERHPMLWGSSVAGYLHRHEDYAEAAQRRLREELSLELPLAKHGSFRMIDDGSAKFVALFTTTGENPKIAEPEHIHRLEWWELDSLDEALRADPPRFTPTFQRVYAFYRRTRDLITGR